MRLHMALELAGLCACVRAEMALVRCFASMGATMNDQITLEAKTLPAEFTALHLRWHQGLAGING